MELTFTRPEFFALCAFTRADQVFGLDASAELPADVPGRQALLAAGERTLAGRGLLRQTGANEVSLEQSVLRAALTLAEPERGVLVTKNTPGSGVQRFIYYERDGACIEHTQPTADAHRLGDVGGVAELVQRLVNVLPLTGNAEDHANGEPVEVSSQLFIAVYNLALTNGFADARDALADNSGLSPTALGWLACVTSLSWSATLAFAALPPGETVTSRDLAVFCSPSGNFLLVDQGDGSSQLGAITAAGFEGLLTAITAA